MPVNVHSIDSEIVLESGFVVLSAAPLVVLGILVGGRLAGDARRSWRHADPPPLAGAVPGHRHQQLSASPR